VIDLASVETYLLVRDLSALAFEEHGARWCPLISQPAPLDLDMEAASAHANRLQLPFVRPERHPAPVPKAMRLAALAAARGQGALFTLRATRLAWSTGADLDRLGEDHGLDGEEDDPAAYLPLMMEEIGIELGEARRAAAQGSDWDLELDSIAGSLARLGIHRAPALLWRGRLLEGRDAISTVLTDSKRHEGHAQPPTGSSDQG
jgi:2-hydroxychromene-2-carboxylate isomerase